MDLRINQITSSLELLFSLSDPSDFRVSVDNGGDSIVVNMTALSSNEFNRSDTFFFSLVSQHRSNDDITNSVDVRNVGLEMSIGSDSSLVIKGDADFLGIESINIGLSASGNENMLSF